MIDHLLIAVYLVVVFGLGLFFSKGNKTTEDYLLGGRNMPFIAIGLSCMMSLLSTISIVQITGEIYNHGLTMWVFGVPLMVPLSIPFYIMFTKFYFKLGSFTPYEYLEYRYDTSVRALVAISAFFNRILYLGLVLYSSSKIFEGAYGWPAWFTILLVGVVAVAYTVLGGMKAVVWTDVIQFFVLFIGLGALVTALILKIDGGAAEAVRCAFREGHGLSEFSDPLFYSLSPYVRLLFFLLLWNSILIPLTNACSDQISIQRLLSTRNFREGLKSQIISCLTSMASLLVLYFIGLAIYTYFRQNPDPKIPLQGGDIALFRFVATQLSTPFPGLIMAAVLAAIMSTLDSGINSMSTIWLKEFHAKFINRQMTPRQEVRVAQWGTILIGAFSISLGLALEFYGEWLQQSVAEVGVVLGLLGSGTVLAFLFAILSKRANSALIWGYTFFAFGEGAGKNLWFIASRASLQAYNAQPSSGFGWAGKLELIWFLLPLLTGSALAGVWFFRSQRNRLWCRACALAGLLILGISLSMGLWYAYSNTLIDNVPKAQSFAFALPVSFFGAFLVLRLCPIQPKEKYQGLTLSTIHQNIIKKKEVAS